MSLSFRMAKPCEHCLNGRAMCEFTRRELREAVRRSNDLAAFAGVPESDGEVVWPCPNFRPRQKQG